MGLYGIPGTLDFETKYNRIAPEYQDMKMLSEPIPRLAC